LCYFAQSESLFSIKLLLNSYDVRRCMII